MAEVPFRFNDGSASDEITAVGTITGGTLTDGTFVVTAGAITGATTAAFSGQISANGTGDSLLVADTLRIAQTGSGLRMTNVGAFDNDGSNNFRIFGTNDLILSANGETGTAITIDATAQDVTVQNDLRIGTSALHINGTQVTTTAAELNQLSGLTLGTAASANTGDFATAAQGALADTALQIVAVDGVTITGDGAGVPLSAVSSGGTPAGNSGEIQFNSAGSFGADSNLFWDNTNDRLGVGTSSPAVALHIQENSLDEILRIESTDATAGSNSAPDIVIKSAKQTTNDYLGSLWWYANDAGGATEAYGRIGMILDDPADGAESGAMFIQSDVEGTLRTMLYLEGYTTGGTGQVVTNYNAQNINFRTLNLGTSGGGPGGYGIAHNASNGRVGIGTSSPSSLLHLVGIDDDNPELRIQRDGVSTQYLSLQNEDASGAFFTSHSAESNKKALQIQSVHNSGGSAAGDNLILFRTGAESSPTERMRISDNEANVIVQSGTDLIVDDSFRVGFTSNITVGDYSISANKAATEVSGGLFSNSIGETAISNANAGWWLTANGMNTSSKYTPALKFGSTDSAFTTDNPKWLAGIIGRATETYSADNDGGMALDFLTFPPSSSANGGPTTRMTIDDDGRIGMGIESPNADLHIVDSSNPELRLQESGQNGYTSLFGYADNYGALRVNNDEGTESTILDLEADSNGTGAQTVRLFRTASATASATKLQILSPGTTTETFSVDASNGNIDTSGTITQSVSSAVLVADGSGVISAATTLQDVAYQSEGISVPSGPPGSPVPSLPGSFDPVFPLDPFGWIEFQIGGATYYTPAYTFSPP